MTAPSAVPDVLASALRVVFVGINPGRVSAEAGAHFANPRNDFWRLLHDAGFTSRLYEPGEQYAVLDESIGITNAAYRTTPGSSDLRRSDFDGSAERLERLAHELKPGWLAFVGKEACRGAYGGRPEHGVQERRLGDTRLFVLPSTSPANAAVPYAERLRWFRELAAASEPKLRPSVRALLLDPADRVLLFSSEFGFWFAPGGGVEPGESDAQALARELAEETGLDEFEAGPAVWTRRHSFAFRGNVYDQRERFHVVRVEPFEPEVRVPDPDYVSHRWWTLDEIESSDETFAPRRLGMLLRRLLEEGEPAEPVDVGL